jgi:hypothetical protein
LRLRGGTEHETAEQERARRGERYGGAAREFEG